MTLIIKHHIESQCIYHQFSLIFLDEGHNRWVQQIQANSLFPLSLKLKLYSGCAPLFSIVIF